MCSFQTDTLNTGIHKHIFHQLADMTSSHVPRASEKLHCTFKRKREWAGQKTSWYYYENNVNFVDKRSGGTPGYPGPNFETCSKGIYKPGVVRYTKWTQLYRTIQPQMSQVPLWMDCYPFIQLSVTCRGLLHINSVGGVFIHCSLRCKLTHPFQSGP